MSSDISNYNINIYDDVRKILQEAREKVYRNVNFEMVVAYWNIGKLIYEAQGENERAEYGESLIKGLSKKLTEDFGKGFTTTNLKYMRQFYQTFQIGHTLSDRLTWSHYRTLIKVENDKKREFYIKECIENKWSVRQLDRQVHSFYYERLIATQDEYKNDVRNEIQTLEEGIKPQDIIKSPYVLEFLDLKENAKFYEKDLESNLIEHLQEFLLELGKGFSFVARQKRIDVDGENFYIDLVFYNYILKCFVLIDLKTAKLTHKDIGQMDFYVRYFEGEIKQEGDTPTIGIILCEDKNETIVKYSVLEDNKNLFASKYMLYLPTEEELKREIEYERRLIDEENAFKE